MLGTVKPKTAQLIQQAQKSSAVLPQLEGHSIPRCFQYREEDKSMHCPYCGDQRTDVFKVIRRRTRTYRYRRCVFCKARFRTQEKAVRWEGVDRKWPGTAPSRNGWNKHRGIALNGYCEISSCGVDFKMTGARRHIDHIVPARLIRKLRAGNPDRRENLECLCGTCHGHKLQADHRLCLGDKLGYLEILRIHNFDLSRV